MEFKLLRVCKVFPLCDFNASHTRVVVLPTAPKVLSQTTPTREAAGLRLVVATTTDTREAAGLRFVLVPIYPPSQNVGLRCKKWSLVTYTKFNSTREMEIFSDTNSDSIIVRIWEHLFCCNARFYHVHRSLMLGRFDCGNGILRYSSSLSLSILHCVLVRGIWVSTSTPKCTYHTRMKQW